MKKAWVLSYPLSAQWRLIRLGGCPVWSESSLGAQSLYSFCHVAAQFMIAWWQSAGKELSCPLDFPLVLFLYLMPFVVFVYVSRLLFKAGSKIQLYIFLTIAVSSTFRTILTRTCDEWCDSQEDQHRGSEVRNSGELSLMNDSKKTKGNTQDPAQPNSTARPKHQTGKEHKHFWRAASSIKQHKQKDKKTAVSQHISFEVK